MTDDSNLKRAFLDEYAKVVGGTIVGDCIETRAGVFEMRLVLNPDTDEIDAVFRALPLGRAFGG
jgi:hypothetical protein